MSSSSCSRSDIPITCSNRQRLALLSTAARWHSVPLPLPSSESSASDSSDSDEQQLRQHHRDDHALLAARRRDAWLAAEALLLPPRQTRVLLWAVPRSISTAFFRAIMEGARIKVLLEPFSNAYYFGEERLSRRYLDRPPAPSCRFADVTALYEQPYTRYRSVFAKDMAYYLTSPKPNSTFLRLLPRGYTHTFLIRHPARSVASLYRLSIDKARTGWDWFNAAEAGFRELHQLFLFVTQRLGQRAIVVDAADLVRNPRKVLVRYCQQTGLDFSEKMLSWKSIDYSQSSGSNSSQAMTGVLRDDDDNEGDGLAKAAEKQLAIAPDIFRGWQPWFEGVLSSTNFCEFSLPPPSSATKAPPPAARSAVAVDDALLPDKVNECIAECLPYYEHLKKFKL